MSQKIIALLLIWILFVLVFSSEFVSFGIKVIIVFLIIIFLLTPSNLGDTIRIHVKAKKIKRGNFLLKTKQEIGIFARFNQDKSQVRVVFLNLTKDVDVHLTSSWISLLDVTVYNLENARNKNENFILMRQLVAPTREHLQIEKDISQFRQQEKKIEYLLNLVSQSDLYSHQKELYYRALSQVQEMIAKARKLDQVYIRIIREVLIGKELASYDPNQIVDNRMEMDSQYQIIKEEYQQLKDTATAYSKLRQSDKF